MNRTNKIKKEPAMKVAVGELKARLSEYVARARAGEEVTITDRGRPVARLTPLSGNDALKGHEAALIRGGLARAPAKKLDTSWMKARRPEDPAGKSLDAILEDRAEGW